MFWSGGSRGLKLWFPRATQSIKTVEMINLAVILLPSLIMAFLMSFVQKISPNNVFLLLFSSSALFQPVGIPHAFLWLTQTPGTESPRWRGRGECCAVSSLAGLRSQLP